MAMYTHFRAACSFGKWPLALTALRMRALMLSMAFDAPIDVKVKRV